MASSSFDDAAVSRTVVVVVCVAPDVCVCVCAAAEPNSSLSSRVETANATVQFVGRTGLPVFILLTFTVREKFPSPHFPSPLSSLHFTCPP